MGKINEALKSKINKLYFDENMTIPEIQNKLNLSYQITLASIKRGDIYKFRRGNQPIKRNSQKHVMLISNEVSNFFGFKQKIINKRTNIKEIVIARQIAHTLSYNLTKSSNAFIGSLIGEVNPATVFNSRKIIGEILSYENVTKDDYLELEKICRCKFNELNDGKEE